MHFKLLQQGNKGTQTRYFVVQFTVNVGAVMSSVQNRTHVELFDMR